MEYTYVTIRETRTDPGTPTFTNKSLLDAIQCETMEEFLQCVDDTRAEDLNVANDEKYLKVSRSFNFVSRYRRATLDVVCEIVKLLSGELLAFHRIINIRWHDDVTNNVVSLMSMYMRMNIAEWRDVVRGGTRFIAIPVGSINGYRDIRTDLRRIGCSTGVNVFFASSNKVRRSVLFPSHHFDTLTRIPIRESDMWWVMDVSKLRPQLVRSNTEESNTCATLSLECFDATDVTCACKKHVTTMYREQHYVVVICRSDIT